MRWLQAKEEGVTVTEYALAVTALTMLAIFFFKLILSGWWQEWLSRMAAAVLMRADSLKQLAEVKSYLKVW